jgi:hypothetical protein
MDLFIQRSELKMGTIQNSNDSNDNGSDSLESSHKSIWSFP